MRGTGIGGTVTLFETLPVTESVRAAVARAEKQSRLVSAAEAAGMRSMLAAALAQLREGIVSAEELDRVFDSRSDSSMSLATATPPCERAVTFVIGANGTGCLSIVCRRSSASSHSQGPPRTRSQLSGW